MSEYLVKVFYGDNVDIVDSLSVSVIDRDMPDELPVTSLIPTIMQRVFHTLVT